MIHPALLKFLEASAEAKDITDVNIAAGIALQELEGDELEEPRLKRLLSG